MINLFQRIRRYLVVNRIEPDVRQKCDRFGNFYWQIYDPISRSYLFFNSEREVRVWLDTRYHH